MIALQVGAMVPVQNKGVLGKAFKNNAQIIMKGKGSLNESGVLRMKDEIEGMVRSAMPCLKSGRCMSVSRRK